MVLYNILRVPYMWYKLCYCASHTDKYTEEERYELLRYIDERAIKGGRVEIEIHGQENIPEENGFMFFPNHQGLFDLLAIMYACPTPFSVVMKKEIQNIPFLKQVFACMKAYALDREDVKQAMRVMVQVTKEVKSGRAYLVIVADDASDNTKKKFQNMCDFYQVPIYFYKDKDTLGHAMGKEFRASLVILDEGFAKGIRKHIDTENQTIA